MTRSKKRNVESPVLPFVFSSLVSSSLWRLKTCSCFPKQKISSNQTYQSSFSTWAKKQMFTTKKNLVLLIILCMFWFLLRVSESGLKNQSPKKMAFICFLFFWWAPVDIVSVSLDAQTDTEQVKLRSWFWQREAASVCVSTCLLCTKCHYFQTHSVNTSSFLSDYTYLSLFWLKHQAVLQ